MPWYALRHPIDKFARSLRGIQITTRHCASVFGARRKASQAARQDDLFTILDPLEFTPKIRYPLAGIKYLAGSHGKDIPEYISFPRPGLPQAYRVQQPEKYSVSEWATLCRKMIDDKLTEYGALLFRGLPLYDGSHFSSFVSNLGLTPKGYEGGLSTRPTYDDKAATFISALDDKRITIEVHNEMAYTSHCPYKLFFYCDLPAGEGCGGLTPITQNTEVLNKLNPKIVDKFEDKQIRYYSCLPTEGKGYLSWQGSFRTNDRKQVEERLQQTNAVYEWRDDGALFYWQTRPATTTHPITGERVWFNQAELHHCSYHKSTPLLENVQYAESDLHYPNHTAYGDGTPIELDVLEHIRAIKWQCTVGIQLRKTDLIVFDNFKAMHGRMSYTGERRLLVFMSAD